MYFDTHCHLNFGAFDGKVDSVINNAKKVDVSLIVIPGTDVPTSKKAIAIAEKYEGIYAAVGIHPHHIFEYLKSKIEGPHDKLDIQKELKNIEELLVNQKVLAIGEIGIDRHYYLKTKHENYQVNEEFVELQKKFFLVQIKLAYKYKKSLIFHNREAKKDVLDILVKYSSLIPDYSSVFHCSEPDFELLEFAKNHKMFIGVDGDITYSKDKQGFIKEVPIEMLVLETDSPFLNPEPNRSEEGPTKNAPKNIPLIAKFIANLKDISIEKLSKQTTENAKRLFKLSSKILF
jgi:TatD DNase family protein